MIGLVYLAVFVVYLLVALWLIVAAVRSARARGIAGWKFGLPVAIVMYLLVFWDHIPTMLVHDYECRNKAGLVVFKTPERWRAEHVDELSQIRSVEGDPGFGNNVTFNGYWLNSRLKFESQTSEHVLLPVRVHKDSIVDSRTGERLVEATWIGSGYPSLASAHGLGTFKGWVGSEPCVPGRSTFVQMRHAFREMAKVSQ